MDTPELTSPTYQESPPEQSAHSLLSGKNILLALGAVIIILGIILALITSNGKLSTPPKVTKTTPTTIEKPTPYVTDSETGGSYTNANHGFTFTYLPQFTAKNTSPDIITVSSSSDAPTDPDAPITGLQIIITKGDVMPSNLDLAKDIFQTPAIKDTMVGGVQAKELSGNGKGVLNGKFIRFVEVYKNGQTIEFAYFEGDTQFTPAIFANILASFKFTKN